MDPDLKNAKDIAVGLNTSKKLIKSGGAAKVLLGSDCSPFIREEIVTLAGEHGVPVDETFTMSELGERCGIDVGCAVCVIRAANNDT